MKKLIAVLLAIVMCVALTACGGVDKSAAVEAYNANHKLLVEVAELANANIEMIDAATSDAVTEISYELADYQAELESEDITQERVDAIELEMAAYAEDLAAYKSVIEEMIAGGEAVATEYDVLVSFAMQLYEQEEEMSAIAAGTTDGSLSAEDALARYELLATTSASIYESMAAYEWSEEYAGAAEYVVNAAYNFAQGAAYVYEAGANNDESYMEEAGVYLTEYNNLMNEFVALIEG